MSSWLHKGEDAINDANKKAQQQTLGKRSWYKPDRFWMPYSSAKEIVFVDEIQAAVHEHHPYIGGSKKGNEFTCPGGPGAPCCRIVGNDFKSRPLIVHFTVIDCDPWIDKDGNEHCFYLKDFPAKFNTHEKLVTKIAENGLAGKVYKARRYKANMEPNVGSEHSYVRDVGDPEALFAVTRYKGKLLSELWDEAEADPEKMEKLGRVFDLEFEGKNTLVRCVPTFNYEEILKPPSHDEIEAFLTGYSQKSTYSAPQKTKKYGKYHSGPDDSGSVAPTSAGFAEDDVPF